jgi:type II secretory pathway pseudopilin PulG
MVSTKLKAGIVSAAIVASLVAPMMVQYQAQARLREQDVALREGADQVSRLQEGNQRLSNLVAKGKGLQPLPNDQFMGLLRLRSEVALLRTKVQEMSQPKTTPTASAKDVWAAKEQLFAARVDMLKQWVENNPSEKIPEIELLTTRDWLHAIDGYTFETTDEYSRAMRLLRINAEMQVMDRIDVFGAFKRYAHDNNGLQPTDLAQLKPYFASSVDDAILQRYEIVPATSLVKELQGSNEWVITQKAPVNEALDSRFAYGLNSGLFADERVTNRWTQVR